MFEPMFAVMNEMLDDIMLRCPGCSPNEREQLLKQLIHLRAASDQFIEEWLAFEEKLADFQDAYPQEAAAAGLGGGLSGLSRASEPQSGRSRGGEAAASRFAKPQLPLMQEPPGSGGSKQPAAPGQQPQADTGLLPPAAGVPEPVSDEELAACVAKGQGYFNLFMFPQAIRHFADAVRLAPECNLARLYLAMSLMHTKQWNDAELHFKLLATLTEHPRWQAISFNALGCIQAVRLNMELAERLFRQALKMDPSFEDPAINLKSCHQAHGPLSLYFGSAELT
ncbi:hypothetical protein ACTHPH_13200 [Paenibacillus pasadenensis]|uniref:Uncharacterized protein n=1 Tax=Paenibacillus pasadenensis TaxID=217090 RepID=A0A2N5N5X5_9BACL|nr:hypothetical protein [Paenibacillus pasadenensis]PLT45689.1 hypothetical protein B8V81_4120 [Paenibacillus pasadenensis]